jgi:UDP-N-acetylmuramoyl-L-alanyl-D-glutamate--2,6-diaminopimelate ligase
VGRQDDYLVLVDYAHTPAALAGVLTVARNLEPRRLITVFGCGGDRDRGKRPLMAEAAGRLSDLAVVTSDNPRTEDPLSIIEQVETGLISLGARRLDAAGLNGSFAPGSYVVEPDRRAAIALACRVMAAGDIVLIAGKGHEDYQILGTDKVRFDDREEARAALEKEGRL